MNEAYIQKRLEGLDEAEERGEQIFLESDNPVAYASDTAELGLDYREDLMYQAENNPERVAARFIGYEITQRARQIGINTLMDEDADLEEQWHFTLAEVPIVSLFKGFSMVDRHQGGYRDFLHSESTEGSDDESARFPSWRPNNGSGSEEEFVTEEYEEDIITEFEDFDGDWFGSHLQKGILVMNADWIAYIDNNYDFPENQFEYDADMEEVREILDELGVAR